MGVGVRAISLRDQKPRKLDIYESPIRVANAHGGLQTGRQKLKIQTRECFGPELMRVLDDQSENR